MPDIAKVKSTEMGEIYDFWQHIQDFGHIFHFDDEKLDAPFKKILEGISEVEKLMDDSYGI